MNDVVRNGFWEHLSKYEIVVLNTNIFCVLPRAGRLEIQEFRNLGHEGRSVDPEQIRLGSEAVLEALFRSVAKLCRRNSAFECTQSRLDRQHRKRHGANRNDDHCAVAFIDGDPSRLDSSTAARDKCFRAQ